MNAAAATPHESTAATRRGLRLIAAWKLLRGLIALAVALAVLELLRPEVAATVIAWAHELPFRLERILAEQAIGYVTGGTPGHANVIAGAACLYALVSAVEAWGLWHMRPWAEVLTTVVSGSLIPVEVAETVRRVTPLKVAIVVLNVAVVLYLLRELRALRAERRARQGADTG